VRLQQKSRGGSTDPGDGAPTTTCPLRVATCVIRPRSYTPPFCARLVRRLPTSSRMPRRVGRPTRGKVERAVRQPPASGWCRGSQSANMAPWRFVSGRAVR
jgi:hypothetical protein